MNGGNVSRRFLLAYMHTTNYLIYYFVDSVNINIYNRNIKLYGGAYNDERGERNPFAMCAGWEYL